MALETGLDPPPFMANTILNFHLDYRHPSLITGGSVLCFYHFIIIHICSWCLFNHRGIMILCCPPWRSVQGSAFRALLCSLVLLTMLVLCACACVLLCLCACSLVLLTMLLLRACACGWGGGEGTSPSRLITANERTPWRSILASAICNTRYHAVHCTHTLIICNIMLYTAQHPALLLEQAWCRFWRCCLLVCLDTAAPY